MSTRKPGPRRKRNQTRSALLDLLKQGGPQDSKTLAEQLEISTMAVRQHIYSLRDDGVVTFEEESRAIGRPAKMWRLTGKGHEGFTDAHAELSVAWLDAARSAFGEAGVERMLQESMKPVLERYRAALAKRKDLRAKLKGLTALREAEGYMATLKSRKGTFLLIESHCPVLAAARAEPGLCQAELWLFRQLLGDGVEVTRTERVLDGQTRCCFQVEPVEV